jgi:GTP cyclohydrolase II
MESMTMRKWVVVAQNEGSLRRVRAWDIARLPTKFGDFKIVNFSVDGREVDDIAIIAGDAENCSGVLTRLHAECLTGDAFASLRLSRPTASIAQSDR